MTVKPGTIPVSEVRAGDLGRHLTADLLGQGSSIENLGRQENAPGNLVGLSPTEGEKIYRRLLY